MSCNWEGFAVLQMVEPVHVWVSFIPQHWSLYVLLAMCMERWVSRSRLTLVIATLWNLDVPASLSLDQVSTASYLLLAGMLLVYHSIFFSVCISHYPASFVSLFCCLSFCLYFSLSYFWLSHFFFLSLPFFLSYCLHFFIILLEWPIGWLIDLIWYLIFDDIWYLMIFDIWWYLMIFDIWFDLIIIYLLQIVIDNSSQ